MEENVNKEKWKSSDFTVVNHWKHKKPHTCTPSQTNTREVKTLQSNPKPDVIIEWTSVRSRFVVNWKCAFSSCEFFFTSTEVELAEERRNEKQSRKKNHKRKTFAFARFTLIAAVYSDFHCTSTLCQNSATYNHLMVPRALRFDAGGTSVVRNRIFKWLSGRFIFNDDVCQSNELKRYSKQRWAASNIHKKARKSKNAKAIMFAYICNFRLIHFVVCFFFSSFFHFS